MCGEIAYNSYINCVLQDECKQPAKPLENRNKNMENLLYTKNNIAPTIVKERRKPIFKISYSLKIH